MRSEARDAIKGWQIGREAAQATLRVSSRRTGDRAALKNDLLFWRSRDTGTQDWKVVLLRNELKKSGQACEVKLLPRELSNGDGRAVGTIVLEGIVRVTVGVRDIPDVGE
jgi:hypothetical protein